MKTRDELEMEMILMADVEKLMKELQAPFSEDALEWRIAMSGVKNGKPWARCLAYIDARSVQERLDTVLGFENWRDEYRHVTGGVMCSLSLKINNEWITKENGSDVTDIEPFKGAISKALVRAASTWGIGRYLYAIKDSFATFVDFKTEHSVKIENTWYNWQPPKSSSQGGVMATKQKEVVVVTDAPKKEIAPKKESSDLPPPYVPPSLKDVMAMNAPAHHQYSKVKKVTIEPPKNLDLPEGAISDKQYSRMVAICKKSGWSATDLGSYLAKSPYNLKHPRELRWPKYNDVCRHIETHELGK